MIFFLLEVIGFGTDNRGGFATFGFRVIEVLSGNRVATQ
jgi:hypothetical protein